MGGVKVKLHKIEKSTFDSRIIGSCWHFFLPSFLILITWIFGVLQTEAVVSQLFTCYQGLLNFFSALEYNFNPYAFLC